MKVLSLKLGSRIGASDEEDGLTHVSSRIEYK